jgi:hypothetical protein
MCSVFVWKEFATWERFFPSVVSQDILEAMRSAPAHVFRYPDDFSSLRKVFPHQLCYEQFLSDTVVTFMQAFDRVRMYHCCRPVSVDEYLRNGIRRIGTAELVGNLRARLLTSRDFLGLTEAQFEKAVSLVTERDDRRGDGEGEVCLGLDDRFLEKYCPHYVTYGSEYLLNVARALEEVAGYDITPLLQTMGTPTVFEVDVPVMMLKEHLRALLAEAAYAFAYNDFHASCEAPLIDFGVCLPEDNIAPNLIAGYRQPRGNLGA